jgi:hypothetical protein
MNEIIQQCKKNNYTNYTQNPEYTKQIKLICKEFIDNPVKWGKRENKFICTPIKKIHIFRSPNINNTKYNFKKTYIGSLYYIFMIVETFEDIVIIEKNANITISLNIKSLKNLEFKTININDANVCILSLLCNVFDSYDSAEKANAYDIIFSNYQHFVCAFISKVVKNKNEIMDFILDNDNSVLNYDNQVLFNV